MYNYRTEVIIKSRKASDVGEEVLEQLKKGPGERRAANSVKDGHWPTVLLPWCPYILTFDEGLVA